MIAGKANGLTIGVVTEREQDGLGRVKVRLPTMGDRETDWCRVLVPYGGKTKDGKQYGQQWVPEVNSEVVVGFYERDPKVALVMGSVYSQERKPPTGDPDEHVFQSRRGDLVVISDQKDSERIEITTIEKQSLSIVADGKTITLQNDHQIRMSGDGTVTVKTKGGIELVLDDTTGAVTLKASSVSVTAGSVEFKKG